MDAGPVEAETDLTPRWGPDETFELGGTTFATVNTPEEGCRGKPYLVKTRPLIEQWLEVCADFPHANYVELGMYMGASMMLTTLAARPRKLVGLDINEPHPLLTGFLADGRFDDTVKPHWQIDQSDSATVAQIIDDEFGDEALDVVIDDASHLYEPTRKSFEVLFPRLRPGGLFVIEDWRGAYEFTMGTIAGLNDPDSRWHEELREAFWRAEDRIRPLLRDFVPSSENRHRFERALVNRTTDSEAFADALAAPFVLDLVIGEPDRVRSSLQSPEGRIAYDAFLADVEADPSGFAAALPDDATRARFQQLIEPGTDAEPPQEPSAAEVALAPDPRQALADLILELIVAKAANPDLMGDVRITRYSVIIERGPAELDPGDFRLDAAYTDFFGVVRRIRVG